ncbi:MAG TPA: Rieske 2Fe-2S domain-containing protein [Conexibacter sp.]|jgi:nitrite reductase/ring-hydroxylating ferredoxin subunit
MAMAGAAVEHWVAALDELPLDRGHLVEVDGRSIGLFRLGDEVRALLNTCPHQGGPVGTGGLFPTVEAEVVGRRLKERLNHDRMVVSCPWHGWEFDVRTGRCAADPSRGVVRFETVVRDGRVAVLMPERART